MIGKAEYNEAETFPIMAQEQGENRTPEERTAELFSLKADALFERLRPVDDPGMVIALIDSERKVRVRSAQPFSQVGNYYKAIGEL